MLYFEIHGVSIRMSFACAHLASPVRISLRSMRVGYQYEVCRRWAWGRRLCRPQRKLRQPLLCPFAFLPPKRIAEGAKAISPDIWRETL